MANVLPVTDRMKLRRSYWLRLFITFAFMVVAAATVGFVSLVPAYFTAKTELAEAEQYQEIQNETRDVGKNDTAVLTARFVNAQTTEALKTDTLSAADAMHLVIPNWEQHARDIIISGFSYELKNEMPSLRISGEARDRASLNAFVQTLRSDDAFVDVSFPVSDLVGGDVVTFSITLLLADL